MQQVPAPTKVARTIVCPQCKSEVPGGAIVEGVVDLAFEEKDGWTVVDFKTDVDAYGLSQGIYFALNWRDMGMASKLLERMRASLASRHRTRSLSRRSRRHRR